MLLRKRPPRLEVIFQHYDLPLYFVTISTFRHKAVLANDPIHSAFCAFAAAGEQKDIATGRYVIMPDHLHLFLRGRFVLAQWARMLKLCLGRELRKQQVAEPIWERGFFDHVLRSDESYA